MTKEYYEMIEQSQTDDEYSEEEKTQVAEWGSALQSLALSWKLHKSEKALRDSAIAIKGRLKTKSGIGMMNKIISSAFPSGELAHQRRLILESRKRLPVERPSIRVWDNVYPVFGGLHSAHIITETGRKVTFKKLNNEDWEWV